MVDAYGGLGGINLAYGGSVAMVVITTNGSSFSVVIVGSNFS